MADIRLLKSRESESYSVKVFLTLKCFFERKPQDVKVKTLVLHDIYKAVQGIWSKSDWKQHGMHVTFVNPPYPKTSFQHPPLIPLGIGYLSAILEKNGFEVDIVDCQAEKLSYDEAGILLGKRRPDIVGVTSTTLTYNSALQIVRVAKKTCPASLTIMGGCHVTFWDREALEACPDLDVVVRGEGESTMLELAERITSGKDFHDVIGTTCREDGKITRNLDGSFVKNLDGLPYPAYHLMSIESFRRQGEILFPILSSRGCVYWCDFCSAVRMFGRKYRTRSVENVLDEIEFMRKKYGADRFTFYDDLLSETSLGLRKYVMGFWREVSE